MSSYHFPGHVALTPHGTAGRLVVCCGTDGVGKTSTIEAVRRRLRAVGVDVLVAALPTPFVRGFGPFQSYLTGANRTSYSYRAISMMVTAARTQFCEMQLLPALDAGMVVLLDRYLYSGLVRLVMWGDPSDAWFHDASRLLPRPDVTFLLRSDEAVIRQRLDTRSAERLSEAEVHELLQAQVLLEQLAPTNDMTIVDTTANHLDDTVEVVWASVREAAFNGARHGQGASS